MAQSIIGGLQTPRGTRIDDPSLDASEGMVGGGRIWLPVSVVILLASLVIGGIVSGLLVVVVRRDHRAGTSDQ
jgi:hypothetical protein